uniref:Secreted protein n=1 Tax=Arundo donax TaxID=35708 RepID=A0A0A9DPW4_ARUDO
MSFPINCLHQLPLSWLLLPSVACADQSSSGLPWKPRCTGGCGWWQFYGALVARDDGAE